jgi:hypothetical protein
MRHHLIHLLLFNPTSNGPYWMTFYNTRDIHICFKRVPVVKFYSLISENLLCSIHQWILEIVQKLHRHLVDFK